MVMRKIKTKYMKINMVKKKDIKNTFYQNLRWLYERSEEKRFY